ncbi:MAG: hypothetical protein SV775_13760, partial [Thermodesulfobacteriota bacterium]|nr:hypothetical protein [Thermodesulfobacteriota bacterium]
MRGLPGQNLKKTGAASVLTVALLLLSLYQSHAALQDSGAIMQDNCLKELLQFTAGSHVAGFGQREMYLASGDNVLKVTFVGARAVSPEEFGNPSSAHTGFRAARPLEMVRYKDLWNSVTLVYEKSAGAVMKSTYHVAPSAGDSKGVDRGSPVDHIRLRYNVPVRIDDNSNLLLSFETGQLRESAPIAWQEINGRRVPVEVSFRALGDDEIGFCVDDYDQSFP